MEKIRKYFFKNRAKKSLHEEKVARAENLFSLTGVTKGSETSFNFLNFYINYTYQELQLIVKLKEILSNYRHLI